VEVPAWFPGLAVSVCAAYYLYSFLKARKLGRRFEEEAAVSLAALVLATVVLTLNVAELVARAGGSPILIDYELTRRAGEEMKSAAEGALSWWSNVALVSAFAEMATMVASWVVGVFTGGIALIVVFALNVGFSMLKGLAAAVMMMSQALWITGEFYTIIASLAEVARALLVPLGLALMPAKPLRKGGAGIFALGVLLGYAAPYALNAAAYDISFKGTAAPLPPPANSTGLVVAHLVQEVPVAELAGGSWSVRRVELPLPPGGVVELRAVNATVTAVAGVESGYLVPALEYELRRVALTNVMLEQRPRTVRVQPIAASNLSCPPEAYEYRERCCPITKQCRKELILVHLELCNFTARAYNNITHRVEPPTQRPDETIFFVAAKDGSWGFAAGKGVYAYELELESEPPLSARWYSDAPWPSSKTKAVLILDPKLAASSRTFNCTIEVTTKEGRRVKVNTTCTEVTSYAYGSLGSAAWLDEGESIIVVNGTPYKLKPQLSKECCGKWLWLTWAGGYEALWFNFSALLLNATVPPGSMRLEQEGPQWWCLNPTPAGCFDETYGVLVTAAVFEQTVGPPNATPSAPVAPVRIVRRIESPIKWRAPEWAARWLATAVYAGNITRPAVLKIDIDAQFEPPDSRVTMLHYSSELERFLQYAQTGELRKMARDVLQYYTFMTIAMTYFIVAVAGCDILSGFLGGPSIFLSFVPSKWRRSYWETAGKAIYGAIVSLATGRGLPSVPHSALIPARFEPVLAQRRRELAQLRQRFPVPRLQAWFAQTRVGQALQAVRAFVSARAAELGAAVKAAIDEALRSAASRLEERGRRVPPRLIELTRRLLTETGPRATYWAYMVARYAWVHRSEHVVNAFLRGAAHALRAHALKKYGHDAHLHPQGFRLLRLADRLELVELFVNNRALAERLAWRAALSAYERAGVWRVPLSAQTHAMLVATQAKAVAGLLESSRPEEAKRLLELARKLERASLRLYESAQARANVHDAFREVRDLRNSKLIDLRVAMRSGERARAKELREELRVIEVEYRAARWAAKTAERALRAEVERVLAMVGEVEEEVRRLAPPAVRDYVERRLGEAAAIAAEVREKGVAAYARAARFLEDALHEVINNPWLPSFVRADAERALNHLRETWIKDWNAVFGVVKMLEFLREEALKGEILAPPARAAPEAQPSLPPDFLHLRSETEKLAQELRAALEKRDYARAADKLPAYVERLVRLSGAPDRESAEWAKTELERLDKVLLKHYHTLCDRLGGEPFAAVKGERLMFEIALSLAHVSPEAAEPLLDRIPDERLRGFAAGYLKAARDAAAFEAAGERLVPLEEMRALKPEERLGYMTYLVEHGVRIADIKVRLEKAHDRIWAGFENKVAEIVKTGEAEKPEELAAKWWETHEPEYIGAALAAALARGYDPGEFMEEHFAQLAAVRGDIAMFEEGLRLARELEPRMHALAERLEGLWEVARFELPHPAPGESRALWMLHEDALARARERAEEIALEAAEIRNEATRIAQIAARYGLKEIGDAAQRVGDDAGRLADEMYKLLRELGGW